MKNQKINIRFGVLFGSFELARRQFPVLNLRNMISQEFVLAGMKNSL